MRKSAILILVSLVALPAAASALSLFDIRDRVQEFSSNLLPQSTAVSNVPEPRQRICDMPLSSLALGSRGSEVVALQEYLNREGHLSVNATGYFGPMTKAAVAAYQSKAGISPVGFFGPRTREHVKNKCGGGGIACTLEYKPVCASKPILCVTTPCNPIQQTYGNRCVAQADGATVLYEGQCRTDTSTNRPPVVSGLSGPTVLTVNEVGSWSISASDPENGELSYTIDWGDAWVASDSVGRLFAPQYSIMQKTSFTHSYSGPGSYTIQITVRDSEGAQVQSSTSVYVSRAACTREYAPVCGRPPGCANSCAPGAICTMACRLHDPVTYSNTCELHNANAEYLYDGQCR